MTEFLKKEKKEVVLRQVVSSWGWPECDKGRGTLRWRPCPKMERSSVTCWSREPVLVPAVSWARGTQQEQKEIVTVLVGK